MPECADQARRSNDREAHRDRVLGIEAHHVHEHRHGEDGATPAQHAERDADHDRQREPHDLGHGSECTATLLLVPSDRQLQRILHPTCQCQPT
jgi:hypothetical protein